MRAANLTSESLAFRNHQKACKYTPNDYITFDRRRIVEGHRRFQQEIEWYDYNAVTGQRESHIAGPVEPQDKGKIPNFSYIEPSPYSPTKRQGGYYSLAYPAVVTKDGVVPLLSHDGSTNLTTVDNTEMKGYPLGRGPGYVETLDYAKANVGDLGIMLAGTDIDDEYKFFMPSGRSLIAHHQSDNPPTQSSIMFDIDGDGLSSRYAAGLHTMFTVTYNESDPSISLNATQSGGDNTGWMLARFNRHYETVTKHTSVGGGQSGTTVAMGLDPKSKKTIVGNQRRDGVLAYMSWERFGFVHPGSGLVDKHLHGINPDNEHVNAGHIWTNAYYYMDEKKDAPLEFLPDPYPNPDEIEGIPIKVYLGYDKDSEHQFEKGKREGLWRWWTYSMFEAPTPPTPNPEKPVTSEPKPKSGGPITGSGHSGQGGQSGYPPGTGQGGIGGGGTGPSGGQGGGGQSSPPPAPGSADYWKKWQEHINKHKDSKRQPDPVPREAGGSSNGKKNEGQQIGRNKGKASSPEKNGGKPDRQFGEAPKKPYKYVRKTEDWISRWLKGYKEREAQRKAERQARRNKKDPKGQLEIKLKLKQERGDIKSAAAEYKKIVDEGKPDPKAKGGETTSQRLARESENARKWLENNTSFGGIPQAMGTLPNSRIVSSTIGDISGLSGSPYLNANFKEEPNPSAVNKVSPMSSPFEMSVPSLLGRAYPISNTMPNWGRYGGLSEGSMRGYHLAPFVQHTQFFGKENGSNTRWAYTHSPWSSTTKFTTGTASGGSWISPPEIMLTDTNLNPDPASTTLSTTVFGLHPLVGIRWGTPSKTYGNVVSGWQIMPDSYNGTVLDFKYYNSSNAVDADVVTKVRINSYLNLVPAALTGSPVAGDIAIDSADSNALKWYDGTTWNSAGGLTWPLAAPDDGTPAYMFDGATLVGSENAGMVMDQVYGEGPALSDILNNSQLIVTTSGIYIPGKLTVTGLIDPTGLVLTEQAATPWTPAAGYGALYVKDTSPTSLIFVDSAGNETTLGRKPVEVNVTVVGGAPFPMAGVADRDTANVVISADEAVAGFDDPDDATNVMDVWLYNGTAYSLTINDHSDGISNVITGLGAAYVLGPEQSVQARWSVDLNEWILL